MLAFAAAALIAPAAFAQTAVTAGWIQPLPADSPSIRTGASMSYDSGNQESVLFGGATTGGTLLSDTWLWDGTTWTVQAPANSPAARQDAAVAYDAGHSLTILFGGIDGNGTVLNDTWEWDGANWTQLSTTGGPTARHGASITYDGTSGKILLFGGIDGNGTYLGDTWTWNGTTWTKLAPSASPSARAFAGLTYNPGQSNDLLFAGEGSGGALNDTWFWNGTTWAAQTPSQSPTARFGATLVYNAAASVPELFGGWDGTNTFGDTWTWNGSTWVRQGALAAISGRYGSAATFNGATNAVQVFGGVDAAGLEGDTWNLYGTVPNFGNVAVGSSVTQPVTFVFTASDTLNPVSPYVVTSQGYAGLDFNDAGGGSCFPAAPFVALDTCTVNVTFSPKAPGVRVGSVNLVDAQGATLAIAQLGGVGMGPQVEFPMPPTAEQNASVYYGTSDSHPFQYRVYELTIDEGGYGFIVDPGYDEVVKESPSDVEESIGVGAFGVALDGLARS